MLSVLVLATCVVALLGHPGYRLQIPNGYSVPNPCVPGGIWEAVGHYDPHHHTAAKNPFALAFAAAGHVWTVALCQSDSDGDGNSNGVELGDPSCTWSVGGTPSGPATGHPGICETAAGGVCSSETYSCGCHGHGCVGK